MSTSDRITRWLIRRLSLDKFKDFAIGSKLLADLRIEIEAAERESAAVLMKGRARHPGGGDHCRRGHREGALEDRPQGEEGWHRANGCVAGEGADPDEAQVNPRYPCDDVR